MQHCDCFLCMAEDMTKIAEQGITVVHLGLKGVGKSAQADDMDASALNAELNKDEEWTVYTFDPSWKAYCQIKWYDLRRWLSDLIDPDF